MKAFWDDVETVTIFMVGMIVAVILDLGWGSVSFGAFLLFMAFSHRYLRLTKPKRMEVKK